MRFESSPASGSLVLRALPRAAPPYPLVEAAAALFFGVVVALRFGIAWGGLACAAEATILFYAHVSPARAVAFLLFSFCLPRLSETGMFLRPEDFVIAALCAAALRRRDRAPSTPLDNAVAVYAGALGLACVVGLAMGTIRSPAQSALTLLKHVELLCGFFAAAWVLRDERARTDLAHALLAAVGVLAAAATVFLLVAPDLRAFNLSPYLGESNHVGGVAALACAVFLTRKENRTRWLIGAGLCLLVLLCTRSRTAMLGMAAAMTVVAVTARSRTALGIVAAGAILLAAMPLLGKRITGMNSEWLAFESSEKVAHWGFPPFYSDSRNRLEVWTVLIDDYRAYPLLGTGPGSRHRIFYESHYFLTLGETGLAGLAAFFFLAWSAWRTLRRGGTPESQAALACLAAMLVMGLTSNSFLISRMAGPFWIFAGAALARDCRAPTPQ